MIKASDREYVLRHIHVKSTLNNALMSLSNFSVILPWNYQSLSLTCSAVYKFTSQMAEEFSYITYQSPLQ